ncbi:hypothetical protein BGY98DRAFT_658001 [Russula aff. rugulosa BPL654]|nr:hypothetical protein BGY98DRAFT_658001 [Russula aff. rugulosa BPL654]
MVPSEPVFGGNALGFHPSSLRPGQDQYSSMPLAQPATSDPSTSRARGGSFSRPSTSHGMAPPIAGTASVPGSAYRDASHTNGAGSFYSYRGDGSISRPSSTPIGPVLTPWTAPGFANPSMNSLGLSERSRDVNNAHLQATRPVSASIPTTARDSVSSWGTAESTSAHSGDLFLTLRRLESAPADSGLSSNDLLPRSDGQLLGTGRYEPIATPQPQLPQAQPYGLPMGRDMDSGRSYSRHGQHPRSQSQTSLPSSRDASQPIPPPLFTPENRGFPYASVPPPPPLSQPSFPVPHPASQPATSATSTRPSSHTVPMPLTLMASFPSAPPQVNSASRPPNSASQPYFPGATTPHSQNPSYRG